MDYDELREYLKTNVLSEYGVLKLRKVPNYIKKEIVRHTSFYEYYGHTHMSLRCYFILEGMRGLPICDYCGKPFSIKTKNQFYRQKFCNRKCSNESEKTKQKTKNTNLEKYGVEYATQNEETIKKQRKTNLQKYGVEHVLQKKDFSEKKKKTTFERHGIVTCFEKPEIQEKIKQTNIEKYGVEYPLLSEEILEKIKQTNIERYGNEHAIGSKIVREKIKQTNIERYGVENPLFSEKILEKVKQTNIERYGNEYAIGTEIVKNRIKQSNLKKYGVECIFSSPEFIDKIKQTNIEKYGHECVLSSPTIQEKIKQTNIERYGVEYIFSSPEFIEKIKQTNIERYHAPYFQQRHLPKETIEILNDKEKFAEFIKDKNSHEISKELGIQKSSFYKKTIKYDVKDSYIKYKSYLEVKMAEFLDELNINYEANNRTILGGKELDFYIPEYNIAIEMNGVYWHSDKFLDKDYHYDKWKTCRDSGIHLISVFEDDWINKKEKVKNIIKNYLGFNEKKSFENIQIKQIDSFLAKQFTENYYLQNFVDGIHYGAYDEDNLISVMTFNHINDNLYEICNYNNNPKLFSELFNYAKKDLNFNEVIVFTDNSYISGDIFKENGFELVQEINPDYMYVDDYDRIHKSYFSKENIKKKFPEFSGLIESGMSEFQMTDILDIPRIYDCGKCEWKWRSLLY